MGAGGSCGCLSGGHGVPVASSFLLPMIPFLPASPISLLAAAAPGLPGSSGPLVTFITLMAAVALVSYIAEYIALTFGRSPLLNWRMVAAAVAISVAYAFWTVWSQQTSFVDQSMDPSNTSFRMFLWLSILVFCVVPFFLCYNAAFSVWFDRWMPGVSLFIVRVLVCLGLWLGYGWMLKTVCALLKGVRLALFV